MKTSRKRTEAQRIQHLEYMGIGALSDSREGVMLALHYFNRAELVG